MKVKIFRCSHGLEKEINKWLQDNDNNIKVVDIGFAGMGGDMGALILYMEI